MMTPEQHACRSRILKMMITKTRKKALAPGLVLVKIGHHARIKELREELDAHRLNFYSLTKGA